MEGYDNYFYPIELKYKTKEQNGSFERFQENLDNLEILKDHGARNLGRYSFWKDVARLQFVKDVLTKRKEEFVCLLLMTINIQNTPLIVHKILVWK